jgi:hydroxymethylpyrimidine/phosphomethylpyrimidine kinase
VKRLLTIGPSDSSGATGIQADLRVFAELEVTGLSAVTAVLAADGRATRRRFTVPPRVVEAQIDAVAVGGVSATKIAALHDRTLVDAVAERVRRRRLSPVVLQPGIVDARGERVLGRSGVEWLRRRLLPQVAVIVLCRAEAEILAGTALDGPEGESPQALMESVRRAGVESVVVWGTGEDPGWVLDGTGLRPLARETPGPVGRRDEFTAALTVRLALSDTVAAAAAFAARFASARATCGMER